MEPEMGAETQRSRDRNILEMVRRLLLSEVVFQEIYKKYKEDNLRFSDIGNWVDDKGQSLLYNLKEQCHSIFRYRGKGPLHKNEWLLDLAIGSIFHEAMKLRENIYQLEVYRPKYLEYKSKIGKSAYERDYRQQFERIISKAEQGVADGMEETRSLFQDAMAQLIDFFKGSSKNPFLSRFLLEHFTLVQKVYGGERTKRVFDTIFKKGFLDAYSLAGRSYLQSGHYDLASFNFSKALKLHPHDSDLRFLLNFSLGMNAYYKNAYSRALSCFTKLIPLRINSNLKRDYLKKAEGVCLKIASELGDEKGPKATAKCQFLAEQIKRML